MTKVVKKISVWRKHHNLFFSFLWFAVGLSYILVSDKLVFGIIYILLAASYLFLHLSNKTKGRDQEFVSWDEEGIKIGKVGVKPLEYSFTDIQNISLTANNLIVKSGAAAGTMLELKGFTSEDLDLLKSRFASEVVA